MTTTLTTTPTTTTVTDKDTQRKAIDMGENKDQSGDAIAPAQGEEEGGGLLEGPVTLATIELFVSR